MAYLSIWISPFRPGQAEAYRAMARQFDALLVRHGALAVTEAMAGNPALGKVTSFPRALHLEPGETVAIDMARFRDKAEQDQVLGAAMDDPAMPDMGNTTLFDVKRMIRDGFKVFADL